jgi:ADP-heptose:LPS heptosyltransferase
LFVGNDSGIAHIAAAVHTPPVVIFGSSSRDTWRPWTNVPYETVFTEFHCQPCSGYRCEEFGEPKCIESVSIESVADSIDRILAQTEKRRTQSPAV